MSTRSGKTARAVSGSAAIGGGGSTADAGTTLSTTTAARVDSTVAGMSLAFMANSFQVGFPVTLGGALRLDCGGGRPIRRGLPSRRDGCWPLDASTAMTDNFRSQARRRSILQVGPAGDTGEDERL